jgi:hypothetical protein
MSSIVDFEKRMRAEEKFFTRSDLTESQIVAILEGNQPDGLGETITNNSDSGRNSHGENSNLGNAYKECRRMGLYKEGDL